MAESLIELRVKRISYEADNINSYELVSPAGEDLIPFTAGGHIDLHLPNGMIRSYSLLNDQCERHRYVIAVNKDLAGRGGSSFVHDNLGVGDIVTVSRPRNNFALCEAAEHSVLIAGGIGITPLLSMVRRLETLGRSWELVYAARTRRAAAFLDELNALGSNEPRKCTSTLTMSGPGACSIFQHSSELRRCGLTSIAAARCRCSKHSRLRRRIVPSAMCMLNISRPGKHRRSKAVSRSGSPEATGRSRSAQARPFSKPCWMRESLPITLAPKGSAAPAKRVCSKAYLTIATNS